LIQSYKEEEAEEAEDFILIARSIAEELIHFEPVRVKPN